MRFPMNVPHTYLVIHDTGDDSRTCRTPAGISHTCHYCRQGDEWLGEILSPDSDAPIGAAGQKQLLTKGRKLERVNRTVVRHKTIHVLTQIIRGASIDTTFVRTDEINIVNDGVSSENKGARLATDGHVISHAMISSRNPA